MKRILCCIVGVLLMCCHSVSLAQKKSPKELRSGVLQFLDSTVVKSDSNRAFKIGDQIKLKMHVYLGDKPKVSGRSKTYLSRPLQERVVAISDTLLKQIWPNSKKPRAYEPTIKEREVILEAIAQLPESYQKILERHLSAFCFVDNFRRSAWLRLDGFYKKRRIDYLILSPRLLKQSVSEFLNFKESTVFADTDSLLQIKIEAPQEQSALWFVLMHEATHIIDGNNGISAFTKDIWEKEKTPKKVFDFENRDHISFYRGERLVEDAALQMYQSLSKTPFPSLYASLSWGEDFADFAALYYMTQIKKLPYRLVIKRGDKELFSYAPMENPIVLERYKGIQRLLRFD